MMSSSGLQKDDNGLFADGTDFRHAAGEAILQCDFNAEHLGLDWLGEFRRAEFIPCNRIVAVNDLPYRVIAHGEDAP